MSGMNAGGYTVAEWLAALQLEKRRLRQVYLWLEVCAVLSALACLLIVYLWPPLPLHQRIAWFSAYMILFIVGETVVAFHFNAIAKPGLPTTRSGVISLIATQILNGHIQGGELRSSLPSWLRWITKANGNHTPQDVLRQVTTAADFYCGHRWLHWIQLSYPLALGWAGFTFFVIGGRADFSDPVWRSWALLDNVIFGVGFVVIFPLLWSMFLRRRLLWIFIPELERQWMTELEHSASTAQNRI